MSRRIKRTTVTAAVIAVIYATAMNDIAVAKIINIADSIVKICLEVIDRKNH